MPRLASLPIIGFFVFAIIFSPPHNARADLSEQDKAEVKALIGEFITQNPELIRDVLTELAIAEQTAREQAAYSLVRNDEDDPAIGPADAAVTIYEFSDYNCGYCKRIFADLQSVLSELPDVKLVVKEFPILAESSVVAAKAAIAAQRQGKFPDFHRTMMTWRGRIDEKAVLSAARTAGLEIDRLQTDMEDDLTLSVLTKTRAAATALEIRGTPALVIGDRLIPGAISKTEILDLINQARAAKN